MMLSSSSVACIYEISKDCRAVMEAIACMPSHRHPKLDFAANEDLKGLCMVASVLLKHALKKSGLADVNIHMSYNHFFIITGELLVDITASQFGHNDIVIKNITDINVNDDHWLCSSIIAIRDETLILNEIALKLKHNGILQRYNHLM